MKPDDVSDECWADFIEHRRRKRAIVTARVVRLIRAEAEKVGYTLEAALDHCVMMGWQGFKADWVKAKTEKERTLDFLYGRTGQNRTIDVYDWEMTNDKPPLL
jgi:hypothetical protein